MTAEKNADLADSEVELRTTVLRRIRWKLYLTSVIILAYTYHNLNFHFKVLDSGLSGIGFTAGFSIQGLTEELVLSIFLSAQVVLFVRFCWFSYIFVRANRALYKYDFLEKRMEKQARDYKNTFHYFGDVPEARKDDPEARKDDPEARKDDEESEFAELGSFQEYAKFDRSTRRAFSRYHFCNVILFPTIVPIAIGGYAIYRLWTSW